MAERDKSAWTTRVYEQDRKTDAGSDASARPWIRNLTPPSPIKGPVAPCAISLPPVSSGQEVCATPAKPALPPLAAGRVAAPLHCQSRIAPRALAPLYAALDLGTNNCRLLIARPEQDGFRVVDAFSRIVRLGEGLGEAKILNESAMARALEALDICRRKLDGRGVSRLRLVATEACRVAENGQDFLGRIEKETGLRLDLLPRADEAHLAAAGCAALADQAAAGVVLFDIGGGSTELVWLASGVKAGQDIRSRVKAWESLPVGVVNLAERHGGRHIACASFEPMVAEVLDQLGPFRAAAAGAAQETGFHLLGTSGTATTLAGLHLDLERYDRRRVDGLWMTRADIDGALKRLLGMCFEERAANGCIGPDRADLVLAGCAIFEAIRRAFPAERVRIGDRGLREGMLMEMMREDGVLRQATSL